MFQQLEPFEVPVDWVFIAGHEEDGEIGPDLAVQLRVTQDGETRAAGGHVIARIRIVRIEIDAHHIARRDGLLRFSHTGEQRDRRRSAINETQLARNHIGEIQIAVGIEGRTRRRIDRRAAGKTVVIGRQQSVARDSVHGIRADVHTGHGGAAVAEIEIPHAATAVRPLIQQKNTIRIGFDAGGRLRAGAAIQGKAPSRDRPAVAAIGGRIIARLVDVA